MGLSDTGKKAKYGKKPKGYWKNGHLVYWQMATGYTEKWFLGGKIVSWYWLVATLVLENGHIGTGKEPILVLENFFSRTSKCGLSGYKGFLT